MTEGLTIKAINRICDLVERDYIIDAVKALRAVWPFGLKEAKDFLDQYRVDRNRPDITGLRNKLLEMADIKEGAVFENNYLRVELKKTGASFLEAHRFFMEILSKLDLHPDSQENHEAFMEMAELFLSEISFDEMNEVCARLINFAGRNEVNNFFSKNST